APEGPQTLTLPGVISGAGILEMKGTGTLALSGANTFTGGLTLTSGAVEVATAAPLGTAANPVNFNGGALRVTGMALTGLGSHPLNTATFNGGLEIADAGNVFTLGSPVSGAGALTKTGAGRLVLSGSNALAGGVVLSTGQLSFTGADAALASSAPLRVDGGTFIVPPVSPFSIGGLSGVGGTIRNDSVSGGSSSPLVLSVGNGGATASYAGVISDALGNYPVSLEKAGAGTQTLSSSQLYSGATRVRAGTLILTGSAPNTSALTIDAGATFSFAGGQLGSASGPSNIPVTNNGTLLLTAGNLTLTGAIVNNGTIRVAAGATLNASGASSFINNGVIDLLDGTAQLPAGLVNGPAGVVLTPGSIGITGIARTGTAVTISVPGYSGHTYHLQKSATLLPDSFADTAAPAQTGNSGAPLTFTDISEADAAFYRVRID
ncbi:MAG: hypothetical protein JWO82_2901, partial [Akkermansiaceae bacterium]|nr:hypothetical protein [Akkermansiaceae bacterium]